MRPPPGVHTLSRSNGKTCVNQWNIVEMGLDHKRHCSFCLALSVGSLTLDESSHHTVRTLEQPGG